LEYIAKCPSCKHHTIVSTIKQIKHTLGERKPQRNEKCINCGKKERVTIIGEITGIAGNPQTVDSEYSTTNRLVIKFW
jgi:transcription elongation factor Elf1